MNRHRRLDVTPWTLIVLTATVASCGSRTASREATSAARPPATADVLPVLALLAGDTLAPDQAAAWTTRIDRGEATVADFIDRALEAPRFGQKVVPELLYGVYLYSDRRVGDVLDPGFVLKQVTSSGGAAVHYLRKPCGEKEAVAVHPWWAPRTSVLVCPDAYQPERWTMDGRPWGYTVPVGCDSKIASPEYSDCGCGPNLVRCSRDRPQYDRIVRALRDEIEATTAQVVRQDMPIAALYTTRATARDRYAEYYYRRQVVEQERRADAVDLFVDLESWPEEPTWAERREASPGQHAGVITASRFAFSRPDRRQRQFVFNDILFCSVRPPFGATTEKVLELGTPNLQLANEGWERLAKQDLCTDCHARLDYGLQFFTGYPNTHLERHFDPAQVRSGKGPFYIRDIRDQRGEGPLTAAGWAELATAQPEFTECLSDKISGYALGTSASRDDRRAVLEVLRRTGRLRPAMREALLRAATRVAVPGPAADPGAMPGGSLPARDTVAVSAPLRGALDRACSHCHDGGVRFTESSTSWGMRFDLGGDVLPRRLAVRMIEQIAYGNMPKGYLAPAERTSLVRALIEAAFPDPAARRGAQAYYLEQMRALPAHMFDNVVESIHARAGAAPDRSWASLERQIEIGQHVMTPGFIGKMSVEALASCKSAGGDESLDRCLERTLRLDGLARTPAP